MLLDFGIVIFYFIIIFVLALSGKGGKDISSEEYFLSSRNLRWYSIAISTIATNVSGYQFLGMMGSAYLFGLAQANLEINAMTGLLMAAFIFVPLYLKERIITITQFIKLKLGNTTSLLYSIANISLFATVGLGAALFWGAYAAELVFADLLSFISEDRLVRITVILISLGIFSAIYTLFGGLSAVVRTDILQFIILVLGGTVVMITAVNELGGWSQLYAKTGDQMHLHLPADHSTLPWISLGGMFLLNINYWCANQTVMQRSIAARSLKDAQVGLMVGGLMKYFMALIIIIPGIALYGILGKEGLSEPDQAFPYLVTNYIPSGFRGVILCALFASLMSTVDSTFNSLATLWSIDIYKPYINKAASDADLVKAGRKMIIFSLITGILMGMFLLYAKFKNPDQAFTHTLNEIRYYINCGIVVLILAAVLLLDANKKVAIVAFLITVPLHLILQYIYGDGLNYFVRAMWVILIALVGYMTYHIMIERKSLKINLVHIGDRSIGILGLLLAISLVILHILFH